MRPTSAGRVGGFGQTVDLDEFHFEFHDKGLLTVLPKARVHFGWQTASFQRNATISNLEVGRLGRDATAFRRSLSSSVDGPTELPVDEKIVVRCTLARPYGMALGLQNDDILNNEFLLRMQYSATAAVDVIHFGAPFGPAMAKFDNTSYLNSIRVFDVDGRDVTAAFDFCSPDGRLALLGSVVAEVPEASTGFLLALGLGVIFCHRRSRSRQYRRQAQIQP
jgi:hypothetical protein